MANAARPAQHPSSSTPAAHPCPGIVPPFLLEQLRQADDSRPAVRAQQTLALDEEHRVRRASLLAQGGPPQPRRFMKAPDEAAGEGPDRTIGDAHNGTDLPGDEVWHEGDSPSSDVTVKEAADGLGATWKLYLEVYGRNSLDGQGMPLDATVHYGEQYDNAFWDGQQMVFGDGDGEIFNRFTISVDVIGHELTHGVTEKTAGLEYSGQSGALNESISDVFGSLVKQYAKGQDAASADWLIGEGLFTDQVQGVALRSMKAPGTAYDDPRLGKDPQPATMDGYVDTQDDNGGVHTNSGIPNHAFYLAATGIGGNAWESAGQVWYDVLTGGSLPTDADFATFATATVTAAGERYGDGSSQQSAIASAWEQVGLPVSQGDTGGGDGTGGQASEEAGGTASDTSSANAAEHMLCVQRSGGIAGRTVSKEIDLRDLPQEEAEQWHQLLQSPTLQQLGEEKPQPDRYVYRIAHPEQGLDVRAAEQQLPHDVRALLDRTLQQG